VAGVRLQKFLAEAGIASRRGAERLIRARRVSVNGEVVATVGTQVDPARDRVRVDGRTLPMAEPKRYVAFHKPAGCLTTRRDPRGRPSVYDLLPDMGVRLHSVGRLDFDTEGLLLLTNDGALTYGLTHPRFGVARVYHVQVEEPVDRAALAALRRGVVLEDGPARAEAVRRIDGRREGVWLALLLREGRYREVRRLCRAAGLRVRRLRRVAYGSVHLGHLAPGAWRELTEAEVAGLRAATAPREPSARRPADGRVTD